MDFKSIKISKIEVGKRTRKELGEIEPLAESINRIGLLNPILVRKKMDSYELLAGHRRLEACKSLDWDTILAQVLKRGEMYWKPK